MRLYRESLGTEDTSAVPHVIVEGPCSVGEFHVGFRPEEHRADGRIIKFNDSFLSARGTLALVETVVVEGTKGAPPKTFFIVLAQREEGVGVRLLSATDPEKTEGVKRALALLAACLKAQSPACRYGRTNLEPFLR